MTGFRFSVPDEWYRRPGSNSVRAVSQRRENRATSVQSDPKEADSESDQEDTAKATRAAGSRSSSIETRSSDSGRKGAFAANRLSNLFDGWLISPSSKSPSEISQPSTPSSSSERFSVSEPMLLDSPPVKHLTDQWKDSGDDEEQDALDDDDFEIMMVRVTVHNLCDLWVSNQIFYRTNLA